MVNQSWDEGLALMYYLSHASLVGHLHCSYFLKIHGNILVKVWLSITYRPRIALVPVQSAVALWPVRLISLLIVVISHKIRNR